MKHILLLLFISIYSFHFAAGGGGTTPPSNDQCSGATTVSCGNNYSGTTVNATTTGETSLPACGTSVGAAGVWYIYSGNGSVVTASLCTGTSYDTKINVFTGSACGTYSSCIASNDDACSSQSSVTFSTTIGTNYYILVNGYSSATGTFSLGITCCTPGVPSCATLNTPANAATNIANCTSLTWTAPATSGCSTVDSYDVYYGTTNPPPFLANTTSTSFPVSGSPSTVYYWQIRPKNSSGAASGCSVRSFTTSSTGNPQYTMVDDANSPSPYNCVTLTTTSNDQRGCAWDVNSTLNFTSNFSYDFTVNLGSSDAGADGLAFVMQNDPSGRCKCGTTGGSLGAGGIVNSVVIEIDTYLNYEDRDDFNTSFVGCSGSEEPDHLDIWYNGVVNPELDGNCDATGTGERPATPTAIRLQNGGSNYNIENGNDHILRISWASGTNTLTAKIMNIALSTTYGTITSTFNPMTVFGTNTPYFGFTASTGGLNNNQSFCNPPILLPVDLLSFHNYCYPNYRKVYWSTASENNHSHFTLEKSLDGVNFEAIHTETSNQDKIGVKEYEFTDYDTENPLVYYRLLQTDVNGSVKNYDVISSTCNEGTNEMTIKQINDKNGVSLKLELKEVHLKHELMLLDLTGKLLFHKEISENETISFTQNEFTNGLYIIQLKNKQEAITKNVWFD